MLAALLLMAHKGHYGCHAHHCDCQAQPAAAVLIVLALNIAEVGHHFQVLEVYLLGI